MTRAQNTRLQTRRWVLGVMLGLMILSMAGCSSWHQPGETATERSLRHNRALRHNYQLLAEDVDKVLLLDKPSRLGEYNLP